MLDVFDPESGDWVGSVPLTDRSQLDALIAAGQSAFQSQPHPLHERIAILQRVATQLRAQKEAFAELIIKEGIKTIREARKEAERCAETIQLCAEYAKWFEGGIMPMRYRSGSADRQGSFRWTPAGLIIGITPYNDPLNLAAHKIAPAFAVGAPIIVKPDPRTPLSCAKLVALFHHAGAAEPMIQCAIGGTDIGLALVSDERPRIISFTGGYAAGAAIAKSVGMKKLLLELGGVCMVGVAPDADIAFAADAIHSGAFWAAGQNCVHAQRIMVDQSLASPLRDALVEKADAMTLTRKLDPDCDMGPMIDDAARNRMEAIVQKAKTSGARILTGGQIDQARFQPTWIDQLPEGHKLLQTEFFGPISTIEVTNGQDDMVSKFAHANNAIHAGLFSNDLNLIMEIDRRHRAGGLIVNDSSDFRIDSMPFGGNGTAGIGREGVADAMEAFCEKRTLVFRDMMMQRG